MKILISVSLWLVASACFFVSCHKEQSVPQLAWGKYYVWSDPDSACQVLRSIAFPEKLSPEDYARYALLTVQATCRSGRTLPPDSLLLSEISDKSNYPNPSIILKIQFFIL